MATTQYAWENSGEGRSLEQLEEDGENGIKINEEEALRRKKQDRLLTKPTIPANVRRGVIRHMCLCIDLSIANFRATDYRPTRMELIYRSVLKFIGDFFDVNPLSHMMIIVTKNQAASIVSPMSPSYKDHERELKVAIASDPLGQPSIQRALQLALSQLKNVPDYAQKELIYLASALGTSDFDNVHDTINELKEKKVRCSVIGMGGELFVLRKLANVTGGTHCIAIDSEHYKQLLTLHKSPPAMEKKNVINLAHSMKVGFPQKVDNSKWDIDPTTNDIFNGGYECPCCNTINEGTLPLTCYVCNLKLLSSPHIARSYHHLMKVPSFTILNKNDMNERGACYCCNMELKASRDLRYRCEKCNHMFAAKCVDFMTEYLFNCSGCLVEDVVQVEGQLEKDQVKVGVDVPGSKRKRM